MSSLLELILGKIREKNPQHADKLEGNLDYLGEKYYGEANAFLLEYQAHLARNQLTIDFSVDCYLRMIDDMVGERYEFIRSGNYSNTSFKDVEKKVYSNPEVMTYHMHGLVLAQYLWFEQYERILFFSSNLIKFLKGRKTYLEIGGGHGLYLKVAMQVTSQLKKFDMVDISESSLNLARGILHNERANYYLKNIFDFEQSQTYDFITVGEVLEHVEDPVSLLKKISSLMVTSSTCFLTTPINAPMIDHIYLFSNEQEVRDLIHQSGFEIILEKVVLSEKVSEVQAKKLKLPIMYAAFIKQKNND